MTSTINCVTKTFSSMSPSVFVSNVLAGAKVLATLAQALHTAVCLRHTAFCNSLERRARKHLIAAILILLGVH